MNQASQPHLSETARKKNGRAAGQAVDRLPPHSREMEQGALGCVLREAGCLAEWFYDLRHQHIFLGMAALFDGGKGLDVITLQQWLRDSGLLEQVGGIPYLLQLQEAVPSAANQSGTWRIRAYNTNGYPSVWTYLSL